MRDIITNYIDSYIEKNSKELNRRESKWEGVSSIGLGFFVACLFIHLKNNNLILLTDTDSNAEALAAESSFFLSKFYPSDKQPEVLYLPGEESLKLYDENNLRTELARIHLSWQKGVSLVCTSAAAFIQKYPTLPYLDERKDRIRKG